MANKKKKATPNTKQKTTKNILEKTNPKTTPDSPETELINIFSIPIIRLICLSEAPKIYNIPNSLNLLFKNTLTE